MVNSVYGCSQAELYLLCSKGWILCQDNLAAFTLYKSKYTSAFVAQQFVNIKAAEDLDDSKARYARAQLLRIDLLDKTQEVLDAFQQLKGYIGDAYRANKAPTMIQAAGQQYYNKASNHSWANVTALLSAMSTFVVNNQADLMDNDNMPANFGTYITTIKSSFDTLYKNWSEADSVAATETDAKVSANNEIYESLKMMFADAQKVFVKERPMAQKFTVTDLMLYVRGTRPSGINGKVLNGVNNKGIEGARISIPELDKMETSDATGQFQFSTLPVGKYTVVIEAMGFEPMTLEKYEIKLGVMHRLTVRLSVVGVAVVA